MINSFLNQKNNSINNTLLIFFDDNTKPSLKEIKYDCLNLYNPKPNSWYFYHIKDYLNEIIKYKNQYKNILLFGQSKGGSAAIVIGHLLNKQDFNNILVWALSPVLHIEYNKTIKAEQIFVSEVWEKVKNDKSIESIVNLYGNIIKLIDNSLPILYSYSYDQHWKFDLENFLLIAEKDCVISDYLGVSDKLRFFDKNRPPYKNIHNILGYYWKIKRDLFYMRLENFILEKTK